MPIIAGQDAIPKEFNSGSNRLSAGGEERLESIFHRRERRGLISNRDEALGMIFNACLGCCERRFGKKKDVSFSHEYRRSGLEAKSDGSSVFMNETLLHSLLQHIYVIIYHSLDFENPDVSFYCYKQLLVIMNEQCNNTYLMPGEDAFIGVMEKYPSLKTLNVAADVYWGMVAFMMLHELSHIFLGHHAEGGDLTIAESEREADREAFLIFLGMICDRGSHEKLEFLEEYIYLAPMMALDFFTLVHFADGTINGNKHESSYPPNEERKAALFDLFANWDGEFDSRDGNGIYNWYIEVVEKFKNDLRSANERGMLESIKRPRSGA